MPRKEVIKINFFIFSKSIPYTGQDAIHCKLLAAFFSLKGAFKIDLLHEILYEHLSIFSAPEKFTFSL